MNKALCLIFCVAAFPAAIHAQGDTVKPVAIKWIAGETGSGLDKEDADRPRVVEAKTAGVKASVAVNISNAEHLTFDLINKRRAEAGLKPLSWSDELEAIARRHSEDMAEFDYFSHRSLNGKVVSDRADEARIGRWRAIGENIAFNRGYADPIEKAVDLWLNSQSHRNNLMSATWKESAIGVAVTADGSYYFTQVFLTRK